jgi:hypothetical protein
MFSYLNILPENEREDLSSKIRTKVITFNERAWVFFAYLKIFIIPCFLYQYIVWQPKKTIVIKNLKKKSSNRSPSCMSFFLLNLSNLLYWVNSRSDFYWNESSYPIRKSRNNYFQLLFSFLWRQLKMFKKANTIQKN